MAVEKHSDDKLCSSDFYVVYVNVNTFQISFGFH